MPLDKKKVKLPATRLDVAQAIVQARLVTLNLMGAIRALQRGDIETFKLRMDQANVADDDLDKLYEELVGRDTDAD